MDKEQRSIEFGLWFAEKREESGYESQRQLAAAVGVSNATVARIEAGYIPKPSTLLRLANKMKATNYNELMQHAGLLMVNKDEGEMKPTTRQRKELTKFLEESEVMFHGLPLTDEDKRRVEDVLTGLFHEAKQMNKRKKKTDDESQE